MIRREKAVLKLEEWRSCGATVLCRADLTGMTLEMQSVIGALTDKELVLASGNCRLSVRLDLEGEEFSLSKREKSPLLNNEPGTCLVILFPARGVARDSLALVVKD